MHTLGVTMTLDSLVQMLLERMFSRQTWSILNSIIEQISIILKNQADQRVLQNENQIRLAQVATTLLLSTTLGAYSCVVAVSKVNLD